MVLQFRSVFHGTVLALKSTIRLAKDTSIRQPLLKNMIYTLGIVYAVYLAAHIFIYFPIFLIQNAARIVTFTLGYEPNAGATEKFGLPTTPRGILTHLSDAVPFLAVDLVVHLCPRLMDDTFFVSLQVVDPIYAQVLQARPRKKHVFYEIVYTIRRSCKRWVMAVGVIVLGNIPVVGRFVLPLVNLYVFSSVVGYPIAGGVAACSLANPAVRGWAMFAFKSVMAMGTFSRDVFKPYFRRVAMKPKDQRLVGISSTSQNSVGFLLPFYLLAEVPWIGAVFFVLAQAIAAVYVKRKEQSLRIFY